MPQEIEAKFYVRDLKKIESRIQSLDALLIQPRVFEMNLRFDLPDGGLGSEGRVLRLRRDTESKFTYKGADTSEKGVISHTEIEFTVGDFEKAKLFLEALGYKPFFRYDKYRTTYDLEECHIMLDELPYGDFVEIEGASIDSIRQMAENLNLNWKAAVSKGYSALFEQVRTELNLSFQDLVFENFSGISVTAAHLGAIAADD